MGGHEQFGEDLALYALDALDGADRTSLEKHLATCVECRRELEQLRGDGALLAFTTLGPKPPARARARLIETIAKEKAASNGQASLTENSRETRRRAGSWWGSMGWVAAAAMIILAAVLWSQNSALKESLDAMHDLSAQTTRELEDLRKIAAPILSPQAQHITVVAVKTPPQPQGKAFYLRNRSSLLFVANNMPVLPAHKVYEIWLIPVQGAPIPAGVFKPDVRGNATVVNPPLPSNTEAKAFAITVENEGGATAPTMPIVMMGAGE
jgi:anti-sigma-K factor RskA